jgi:hypothetical protein
LDKGNGEEELEQTNLPEQGNHSHVIRLCKRKACYDMINTILCNVTHDGGGGGGSDDGDDDDDDDDDDNNDDNHHSQTLAYYSGAKA